MSQTMNTSNEEVRYTIRIEDCISCAACASVAPTIFQMEEEAGSDGCLKPRIVKQPQNFEEVRQVEEATAACPVQAIIRA